MVPVPLAYVALRAAVPPRPMPMDGVPPEVSTSTASLKVTVTPTVSPTLHCASVPAPLTLGVPSTVGGTISTCCSMLGVWTSPLTLMNRNIWSEVPQSWLR